MKGILSAGRKRQRLVREINVVPYIDVMLVLLVIFMITAPLLRQGVEVDLPTASGDTLESVDPVHTIMLTIAANGRYHLLLTEEEYENIDPESLATLVREYLTEYEKAAVFVQGDKNVPYGEVISGMAILQQAGATNLALITQPIQTLEN